MHNHSETAVNKVFISHAYKDRDYVDALVELFKNIGLSHNQIFCTSAIGYDIKIDEDILSSIKEQFQNCSLHFICMHSDNYYKSAICLNEMGAAWVLDLPCTSMLLPGFETGQMTGVINSKTNAIKLHNREAEIVDKLTQLCEKLLSELKLPMLSTEELIPCIENFINHVDEMWRETQISAATIRKRPF